MCGGGKSHYPEHRQRVADKIMRGQGEGDTSQRPADRQLHYQDPETLGAEKIDKRAPQRFDYPRQVKPTGVKGDLCIGKSEIFVKNNADGHGDHIRDTFGQIDRRNPQPGFPICIIRYFFFYFGHGLKLFLFFKSSLIKYRFVLSIEINHWIPACAGMTKSVNKKSLIQFFYLSAGEVVRQYILSFKSFRGHYCRADLA